MNSNRRMLYTLLLTSFEQVQVHMHTQKTLFGQRLWWIHSFESDTPEAGHWSRLVSCYRLIRIPVCSVRRWWGIVWAHCSTAPPTIMHLMPVRVSSTLAIKRLPCHRGKQHYKGHEGGWQTAAQCRMTAFVSKVCACVCVWEKCFYSLIICSSSNEFLHQFMRHDLEERPKIENTDVTLWIIL